MIEWSFCFFFRVFSDRLIDDKDREAFVVLLSEKLGLLFDQTFHNICPNKQPPVFGKFDLDHFCQFISPSLFFCMPIQQQTFI